MIAMFTMRHSLHLLCGGSEVKVVFIALAAYQVCDAVNGVASGVFRYAICANSSQLLYHDSYDYCFITEELVANELLPSPTSPPTI